MRLRSKFSFAAAGIVVLLSVLLEGVSLFVFNNQILALNRELFDEKVDRLVSLAYEQEELFFEGIYKDVKDGQQRVITKLDILYRNNQKDSITYPFVVDTKGKLISHPAESRWRNAFKTKWEKGDQVFNEKQMAAILSDKEGEFKFRPPGEPQRWVVYTLYEPWGWVFCMTTTTKHLSRATVSFIGIAFFILVFAIALSLLGVFVLSSRFTQPIHAAIARLQEITRDGIWSATRLPVRDKDSDEAAELARAVNVMAENLDKVTVSRDSLVREVDERKSIEAKLRQAEKMGAIGQLAGGIAHDLNNGLTPVTGYLDMLLAEESLSEEVKGMLAEAKLSTQRCIEVVQKLMNFSRPTAQARSPLDVGRMLSEFKTLLRPVFPATIQVEIDFPQDIGILHANESDLMTVLMNLAINARYAMSKEGGKFSTRASNVGDKVFLVVSDTGTGMPPEVAARIFEPFFTTKEKGHGTGLGLAMAYNIVKDHGGTIEVSSQPGKGTQFYIYLPRQQRGVGAVKSAAKQPLSSGDIPKGHGHILFVDDEAPLRTMGKTFLERLGYTVHLAADGEQAVQIYRECHKDVAAVVMDMTMPKLSGLETIKRLLQIDASAKIVVASGYTAEATTQELLNAGAKTFIQKPYTIASLAQALQQLAAPKT